jgi:hypothetical protein
MHSVTTSLLATKLTRATGCRTDPRGVVSTQAVLTLAEVLGTPRNAMKLVITNVMGTVGPSIVGR